MKKKAQTIIGYIIILTAIVAGVIAASGSVKSAIETRLNSAVSVIGGIVTR